MKYLLLFALLVPCWGQVVKPLKKPIPCNRMPSCELWIWHASPSFADSLTWQPNPRVYWIVTKGGYRHITFEIPNEGSYIALYMFLPSEWATARDGSTTCYFLSEVGSWQYSCASN